MEGDDAGRWRRIEEICDAALGLHGPARIDYLESACAGDGVLRGEVDALLAHEQTANGFLSLPHVLDALRTQSTPGQDLKGTRLGPYTILDKLGEGGMGVVYRAHDTRLDRDVALKLVTHGDSSRDFARLRSEARAAGRLNHPNVCTVYEVAVTEGVACIAMEWIDGVPLNAAIPSSGWDAGRVCAIGHQVAAALSHAHGHGVTHRDLKSANVMLLPDGRVKVIDFGIADRITRATDQTQTHYELTPGMAGTLPYMAPEQLAGAAPSSRSDLWSLGVLLFEMTTGRRPFSGAAATVAAAIMRDPYPPLPAAVPQQLSKAIEQCLAKEPSQRPANALAVVTLLEKPPQIKTRRRFQATALAGALAIATIGIGYLVRRDMRVPDTPATFANPKPVTTAIGVEEFAAWSPDGRTLAYMASMTGHIIDRWDIWVTQPAGGTPINRTAGFGNRNMFPRWSPSGSMVSFWSDQDGGGCYIMPALGGAPRRVAGSSRFDPNPAEWSDDGTQISCVTGPIDKPVLTTVSVETGTTTGAVELPGGNERRMFVTRSPDGKHLALAIASAGLDADLARLVIYESATGTEHAITDGRTKAWSPFWSRDGRSLFYLDVSGSTMDLKEQRLTMDGGADGAPRTLTAGVGMRSAALSHDGTRLAYSVGRRIGNAYRVPFRRDRAATWADTEQLTFDQASVQCLDLDPTGTRLALSSNRSGSFDLWTMPAAGGSLTQVTSDPSAEWCPVWSPDGASFTFFAYRSGNRDVWTMPAAGGEWKQITTNPGADLHPRWTSGGKAVVYLSARGTTIGIFQSTFDGAPDQLVSAPSTGGRVSPIDRLLVDRDIDSRISILDLDGRRPRRTLAVRSETVPIWSIDGKQLLVRSAADRLTSVDVDSGVERSVLDLSGRRGSLNVYGTPTDGKFVYFIWEEDLGDIWTMDVQTSEAGEQPR